MHRRNQRLHIGRLEIRVDKSCLEFRVNGVLRGIPVGILLEHPAVVVDGHMQRLRSIADIVPQPSGVEKNGSLYGSRICVLCGKLPIIPHGRLRRSQTSFVM